MRYHTASPIVICFYTLDTPYEQEVLNLKHSCEKWDIELLAEPLPSRGSWEANCALKPQFILDKLESLKRPIFWADADSVFLKKPDFAQFLPYDVSVREMPLFRHDPHHRYNAAAVFINATPAGISFAISWRDACLGATPFLDQYALGIALSSQRVAAFYPMPVSYCKVFDADMFFINDEDVVLEQTQASRRYRNFFQPGTSHVN